MQIEKLEESTQIVFNNEYYNQLRNTQEMAEDSNTDSVVILHEPQQPPAEAD